MRFGTLEVIFGSLDFGLERREMRLGGISGRALQRSIAFVDRKTKASEATVALSATDLYTKSLKGKPMGPVAHSD